jgi:aryl-alcohol dehydrogenase-like predicted oxidoreductase
VNKRRLGRSDLKIGRLGFGAWAIGGVGWKYHGGRERDETSIAAMLHAFQNGVNWVDTAPTYGGGHSEELVGKAIRLATEKPMVFTKCGRRWDSPDTKQYSDLRPSAIRADCEASLRRLGVDVIDLLQIHWPEEVERTPIEESWAEMLRLVEQGKARAVGVCNFNVGLLERCEAIGHVDSLQTLFSMIAREAAAGLIQWCAANGTGVLAYSPMHVGLLTDAFKEADVERVSSDDWRRRDEDFRSPRLQQNLALRDSIRPTAAAHRTTVAATAVGWVLSWPEITGAIVGARTREQVDGWTASSTVELTEEDLAAIASAIDETGAGRGPARRFSAD